MKTPASAIAVALLFIFAAGALCADPDFSVYTFKADPTLKIGLPAGWQIAEQAADSFLSAVITRSDADDSEGFLVFFIPFSPDSPIKESSRLSSLLLDQIRLDALPGLSITREYTHKDSPIIHVAELKATVKDIPLQGKSWCALVANDNLAMGIFALFHAPATAFGRFDSDIMLASVLAPALGLTTAAGAEMQAKPDAHKPPVQTTPPLSGQIAAINRLPDGSRAPVTIDPVSRQSRQLAPPQASRFLSPAVSAKASALALPMDGVKSVIIASWPDTSRPASVLEVPAGGAEIHVSHPTISYDGKLIAFRVKGLSVAGRVDSLDWSSGAYMGSFTAIANEVAILGLDLADKKPKVSYLSRDMLDMESRTPLVPAFSPAADRIAFISFNRFTLLEGTTGAKIREFDLAEDRPIDISGLAWSPDGKHVAYFQRKELDGPLSGNASYFITLLDPETGARTNFRLPANLRPASNGAIGSAACLDFSPDGGRVVFCAEPIDPDKSTVLEDYGRVEAQGNLAKNTDLYIYDLRAGATIRLTDDGRTFDPVWKGR